MLTAQYELTEGSDGMPFPSLNIAGFGSKILEITTDMYMGEGG